MPIVIVSVASESGELVLNALDAGAVDFVQKPTALAPDRLLEIGDDLIEKVKAAARGAPADAPSARRRLRAPLRGSRRGARHFDIVVIGISTGGPQALRTLIRRSCPPTCRCRWPSCSTCRSATRSSTRASSTSCPR